ncbi:MAG: DNA-processing protein DprA [Thermomicrobiales bacterium]|nr:DNA-processing protein DprA [Thermomicrobiales bacterium]
MVVEAEISKEERACLVALSQVTHVGPVRLGRLREYFGSLDAAWRAGERDLRQILDERALRAVLTARASVEPELVLDRIAKSGAGIVTVLDDAYPRILREIPSPPPVLYYRGTLPDADERSIAIVGTRRATSYGREVTSRLASELAAAGIGIVSGLAKGIDGVAHRAALDAGGRTFAVLGSGVDVIYPHEHRQLAERTVESGALISDYPPGTRPDAPNFPPRNRIISGLSLATVVVEAPARSGALITVGFAADQGRDVYAVPGSILSPASDGTNRLLRQGALPLTSATDLLEDLNLAPPGAAPAAQLEFPMTDDERAMYARVTSEPQHIDELAYSAGLSIAAASALMTMLELKGLVANAGGQHFMSTAVRPKSTRQLPS